MALRMLDLRLLVCLVLGSGFLATVLGFDNTRKDNLAIYWGQDGANSQQRLSFYCNDDTVDVIPLAFLYIFRGTGGDPVIDFANTCNQWDDPVFSGTALANCQSAMESDIKFCQSKGKLVTLSLGGGTGQVGFSSDSDAQTFATQVFNMFLGGTSSTRPFGSAVLDGLDLDIESGTPAHYPAFVNQIRSLASSKGESVYITAAPQCPFPDAYIGAALNQASFDAVYVQFYNNYCGLDQPSEYNFDTWDNWAKTTSFNKDVKVYIGAPGSAAAAGTGYVSSSTLASYVSDAQSKYSSFGGVMMWDMDTAYTNDRFDLAVKNAMVASAEKLGLPPPGSSSSAAPSSSTPKGSSSSPKAAPSTSRVETSSVHPTTASVHPTTASVLSSASVHLTSASVPPTSVSHPTSASVPPTTASVPSTTANAPSTSAVSISSVETSVVSSVIPTSTDSSAPTSTFSRHPHHFRPHETINAAASSELKQWEQTAAWVATHFRPSATGAPVVDDPDCEDDIPEEDDPECEEDIPEEDECEEETPGEDEPDCDEDI